MKKISLLFILILLSCQQFLRAQTVQAAMDTSALYPNAVNFWLRADLTTPQDTCASSLQFSIAIPDSFTGVLPTSFTVDSSAWPGSTWVVAAPYLEAGFWHYDILTAFTPCMSYTANVDYFAMRVSPVGGTTDPYDYYLLCLPDGGTTTGGALFYHFGAWLSNGSSLYYARPGTTVNNQFSYDIATGVPGVAASWSKITDPNAPLSISEIVLQAKWINENAQLKFNVTGEVQEVVKYNILKGTMQNEFTTIATIDNTMQENYNYTDSNAMSSDGRLLYKIVAIDINGKVKHSNSVNLAKPNIANSIIVYPVPVTNVLHIQLNNNSPEVIVLTASGQIVLSEKTAGVNHQINMSAMANGMYMLKVRNANGTYSLHKISKLAK
jgi:hypothetical protein